MEIIKELQKHDCDSFLLQNREHHHIGEIEDAFKRLYRYKVHIYINDFNAILINSSTEDRELNQSEYPTLLIVVDSIIKDKSFFNTTRRHGMLSGTKVKEYYDEFIKNNHKPEHFFLIDGDEFPEMNLDAQFYVRDGMHKLVAYGLATQMNKNRFPICGYYCSNKKRRA